MVLIWLPFLLIFAFAARGDTSALHIGFHVSALTLLIGCVAVLRRGVGRWPPRFTQALGRLQQVSVGVSIVGHLLELGVAFLRLGQDGFRNRDTADLWQHGPHVWAANLTVPAMTDQSAGGARARGDRGGTDGDRDAQGFSLTLTCDARQNVPT